MLMTETESYCPVWILMQPHYLGRLIRFKMGNIFLSSWFVCCVFIKKGFCRQTHNPSGFRSLCHAFISIHFPSILPPFSPICLPPSFTQFLHHLIASLFFPPPFPLVKMAPQLLYIRTVCCCLFALLRSAVCSCVQLGKKACACVSLTTQ